jgi:ABC-type multidrug transport system ATPase subunit
VIYTTQMVGMAVDFSDYVCVIRDGGKAMLSESAKLREYLTREPEGAEHILRGSIPTL